MNLPPNRSAWPPLWRERWAERAAIMEFQANLSRETAEFRAEQDVRKQSATEKREERTA